MAGRDRDVHLRPLRPHAPGCGDLTYGYDANGNRTSVTYPGSLIATWTMDFADRERSLSIQEGAGPVQEVVKASPGATYRAQGPLATLPLQNGRTETRAYDRRHAVDRIRVGTGTAFIFDWDYTLDLVGNVTTINDVLPTNQDRAFGYQDHQYFLASASGPWLEPLTWTYDRIGNRLTEQRGAATDTYLYLDNAALSGDTAELSQIQLGAGGARDYTFGPAGHLEDLTAGANALDFTNDATGQLGAVERPAASESVTLRYDGRGYLREIRQHVSGTWTGAFTEATYSSEGTVMALRRKPTPTSDEERTAFLYFSGRPVAQWKKVGAAAATVTYLSTDHLGTPALATDAAGAEIWEGGFEPFGADFTTPTAESLGLLLRFPGQWKDPLWSNATLGADIYYNVHRWYEAGTGRYTRTDPLRLLWNESHFLYAQSSPLRFTDPWGLQPQIDFSRLPPGAVPCAKLKPVEPSCCDAPRLSEAIRNVTEGEALYCANKSRPPVDQRGGTLPVPWYRPQGNPCVDRCICAHEEFHVWQVTSRARSGWTINQLECEAYGVHKRCLFEARRRAQPLDLPFIPALPMF